MAWPWGPTPAATCCLLLPRSPENLSPTLLHHLLGACVIQSVLCGVDVNVRKNERRIRKLGILPWQPQLVALFMKECNVVTVELFLLLINPVEFTSKQFTLQIYPVMSVANGAYLKDFSRFLWSRFIESGTVSSKMCTFFWWLSMMTISGF